MNRRRFLNSSLGTAVGFTSLASKVIGAENCSGVLNTRPLTTSKYTGPAGMYIAAPSTVCVGEEFSVGVKILADSYFAALSCFTAHYPEVSSSLNTSPRNAKFMDNVPTQWDGTLEIIGGSFYKGPDKLSCDELKHPYQWD